MVSSLVSGIWNLYVISPLFSLVGVGVLYTVALRSAGRLRKGLFKIGTGAFLAEITVVLTILGYMFEPPFTHEIWQSLSIFFIGAMLFYAAGARDLIVLTRLVEEGIDPWMIEEGQGYGS